MAKFWKVAGCIAGSYAAWRVARYASTLRNRNIATGKHILILGGGFGGREAAAELARLLPGRGNGEITLVDERPYLLFTPMLTDVVGGDVRPGSITSSVACLPSRVKYLQASVETIDLRARSAKLSDEQTLRADQIVVALGSSTNFHQAKGVEDVAFTVKSIGDAAGIYRNALTRIEEAEKESDPVKRKEILTFVVAGGGYTGVETMAALDKHVRTEIRKRPSLDESEVRMLIVEPMDRIMMEVPPDLAAYSQKELEAAGVEVIVNIGIKEATAGKVSLTDGRDIPCRTLIWTAGVMPSEVVQRADAPKGKHHGLQAEETLAVTGRAGVWAVGDCAEIPQHAEGESKTYAPTAQNATREGVHVARNIVRSLRGDRLRPFQYTPIGSLAIVGKGRGVAHVYGHSFSGIIASAM